MTKAKNPAIEPALNQIPAHNLPKINTPKPGWGIETSKRNYAELTWEERKKHAAVHEQQWLARINKHANQKTTLTRGS